MSVKASDGAVVILVLWILAILALLGLGLGYAAAHDQRLVSYQRDRLTALYLAKAGYFRALAELKRDATPQVDSFLDPWANNPEAFREATLGDGGFTVSYPLRGEGGPEGLVYGVVDEERKVNLNTAPKAVLVQLPGMTEEIADAIVALRAERSLGESRDRAFEVLEELLLVDGTTDQALQALRPFITIYGDGKVNLNTAPREVLEALGMRDSLVDKILRFRWGLDGVRGTSDDQMFGSLASAGVQLTAIDSLTPQEAAELTNLIAQNRLKVTSSFFRIGATGRARGGKILRSVEGVVRRGTGPSGAPTLLAWHEN